MKTLLALLLLTTTAQAETYYACKAEGAGEPALVIKADASCNPAYLRNWLKLALTDKRAYKGMNLTDKEIDEAIRKMRKAYRCQFVDESDLVEYLSKL